MITVHLLPISKFVITITQPSNEFSTNLMSFKGSVISLFSLEEFSHCRGSLSSLSKWMNNNIASYLLNVNSNLCLKRCVSLKMDLTQDVGSVGFHSPPVATKMFLARFYKFLRSGKLCYAVLLPVYTGFIDVAVDFNSMTTDCSICT